MSAETPSSSREGLLVAGAAPEAARGLFGIRLPVAERYVATLAGPGIERGLVGPREAPRLWDRHVLNCAVVTEAIAVGETVADVGSGAGLPGLVWAIVRPDLELTLVEPLLRRSTFLSEVASELELSNVTVLRARAEDLGGELAVDVVTARAVAPIAKLARWTMPLLRPGGRLLALKGESVSEELTAATKELCKLGATSWRVREFGVGVVNPATRVAEIEK